MGSAGAKVAAVVRGEADMYVHAGGQYEWDSAAPVAVAQAAGLHASPARRVAAALQPARTRSCPTSSSAGPSWRTGRPLRCDQRAEPTTTRCDAAAPAR